VNRLSAATLPEVRDAEIPSFDRRDAPTIAHLGVGAFARAHVAVYADALLRTGAPAMIRGVSMRSRAAEDALAPQDGLYTVTTREPGAPATTAVIGSLASVGTGAAAAMAAVADAAVGLVTLTVTEKAYEDAGLDGVPHVLGAALAERHRIGAGPLVVASLDNLLDNGHVLRERVLAAAGGEGAAWIAEHVAFPRSVVDRMVPAATDEDRAEIAARLGVVDGAAVVGEAHRSWVLEAVDGLPALDRVGVEVVADIEPYQRRKLWLLNGPHSAVAYAGLLAGHRTIAEAVVDPAIAEFVRQYVDAVLEVADLDAIDGAGFAESSLRRFANPALGHTCAQVAMDGDQKLRQRVLPVIERRRERGLPTGTLDAVVDAWKQVAA
jgi:fructuronate reductase